MLFRTWQLEPGVVAVVCVLDVARDVVFGAVAAGSAGVGGCDVAVERWGSGLTRGGCGLGWSRVDWPGIQRRLSVGAGRGSEVEEERVVVVVVNDVGVVDGGCAGTVSGDVVVAVGMLSISGCGTRG